MRSRARILLVGYGARGRVWETELRRRRDVGSVGACDPDANARGWARARGLSAYERIEEALASGIWDGAIVASPAAQHPADARALLEAAVPVIIEKPLALSAVEADSVVHASEVTGVRALCAQNFHLRPIERAIRSALGSGRVGQLRLSTIACTRPAGATPRDLARVEHGVVWDMGAHHIHLFCARAGGPPVSIDGTVRTVPDGREWRGVLTWEDGAVAHWSVREGAPLFHTWQWIEGNRAALAADDRSLRLVRAHGRPRRLRVERHDRAERLLLRALFAGGLEDLRAAQVAPSIGVLEQLVAAIDRDEAPLRKEVIAGG